MRRLGLILIASLLLPAYLHAGPMYGSVTRSGRGVPRATIQVQCPGGNSDGTTIGDGSYRINVGPEGRCTFRLTGYPGAVTIVYSYAKPTHYDFELVDRGGGQFQLLVE